MTAATVLRRPPLPPRGRHLWAPRNLDKPEPGYYRMRLVKGGALVACAIVYGPPNDPETGEPLDRSWRWSALIDGQEAGEPDHQPTANIEWIWTSGEQIDRETYDLMLAQATWDRTYAPKAPAATPRRAIPLNDMPLPF